MNEYRDGSLASTTKWYWYDGIGVSGVRGCGDREAQAALFELRREI